MPEFLDPPPRALAEEFRRQPLGHHSPDLQSVLTRFRSEPMDGKYVLICTRPHAEWKLGQLSGVRGDPVTMIDGVVFTSRAAAEWDVFKRRWSRYFGEELTD